MNEKDFKLLIYLKKPNMTRDNNLKSILDSRPILIIANSSWYINITDHY